MALELDRNTILGTSQEAALARSMRLADVIDSFQLGVETRSGFVYDFVIKLNSAIQQASHDLIERAIASQNPYVAGNLSLIESDQLTAAAESIGLTRLAANNAAGTIQIEMTEPRIVLVPSGTAFVASDGRRYAASKTFIARLQVEEVVNDFDRLVEEFNGTYSFSIDAVALTEGIRGRAIIGEELTPVGFAVGGLSRVIVRSGFQYASDAESNASLASRMRRTIPNRSLSSRASLAAFLTQPELFPSLLAVSTIGYGDQEMRRGKTLPAGNSMVDTFIRSSALPISRSVYLTAEPPAGDDPRWTVSIDRHQLPGFYGVQSVYGQDGRTWVIDTVERAFDASDVDGEYIPDIQDAVDAAFSAYQTAIIYIRPVGNIEDAEPRTMQVVLVGQDFVGEAQEILNQRRHRFVGGDVLVRAAIPTMVAVRVQVNAKAGVGLTGADLMRSSIASSINNAGFAGILYASNVATIVNNLLPPGASVAEVELIAETLLPDGTREFASSRDRLMAPTRFDLFTTPRTTVFFCEPTSVSITAYEERLPVVS